VRSARGHPDKLRTSQTTKIPGQKAKRSDRSAWNGSDMADERKFFRMISGLFDELSPPYV
jgi:hypothetical protein